MLRHLALAALLLLVPTTLVFGQEVADHAGRNDGEGAGPAQGWHLGPERRPATPGQGAHRKGALEVQVKALEGATYREMYDELCRDLKISRM